MKRYALIVGNNEYENKEIRKLTCAVNDARSVANYLGTQGYETILETNATSEKILKSLSCIVEKLDSDDLFLFYFSGHGHENASSHYLLGTHADPNTFDIDGGVGTVNLKTVSRQTEIVTRRIFILDCCRDNLAHGKGISLTGKIDQKFMKDAVKPTDDTVAPPLVVRSCTSGQKSFEDPASGHGFFTLSMLEAMKVTTSFSDFIKKTDTLLKERVRSQNMRQRLSLTDCTYGLPLFDGWSDEGIAALPPQSFVYNQQKNHLKTILLSILFIGIGCSGFYFFDEIVFQFSLLKKRTEMHAAAQKLLDECHAIKTKVESRQQMLKQKNLDRGQTFGAHLDAFEAKMAQAGKFYQEGSYQEAITAYTEADAEADWLYKNIPLRDSAARSFNLLAALKARSEKMDAAHTVSNDYSRAAFIFDKAEKALTNGDFATVEQLCKEGVELFNKVIAISEKNYLENLRKAADEAIAKEDWTLVLKLADKIRTLNPEKADELITRANREQKNLRINKDLANAKAAAKRNDWKAAKYHANLVLSAAPENAEAKSLFEQAEYHLGQYILLQGIVNGKTVSVDICWDGSTWHAGNKIKVPADNKTATVFAIVDDVEYHGTYTVNKSWTGLQKKSVRLAKIKFDKHFDYHKYFSLFERKAQEGNRQAQFRLGICYYQGRGCQKNYSKAFRWGKKSANADCADGYWLVAYCYRFGRGVSINYDKAITFYKKAIDKGHVRSLTDLGALYYNTFKDTNKTFQYSRKAAMKGEPQGMYNLGYIYEYVFKNPKEALKWYQKAAEAGSAAGQHAMGNIYAKGLFGVRMNGALAMYWYHKSAEQDNWRAHYSIALSYRYGKNGCPINYSKYQSWNASAERLKREAEE